MQYLFLKEKRLIISLVALLLLSKLNAEELRIPVKLAWVKHSQYSFNGKVHPNFITFKGAIYGNNTADITPLFMHKTTLPAANISSVRLERIQKQQVSPADMQSIEQIKQANFDVQFTQGYERKQFVLVINVVPFAVSGNNDVSYLESFDIVVSYTTLPASNQYRQKTTYASQSVLAAGNWFKFHAFNTGIHRVTKSMLRTAGMNVDNIDPRTIKVFGNGPGMLPSQNDIARYDDLVENAIVVTGEQDGVFNDNDEIYFYAKSQRDVWRFDSASGTFNHITNVYTDATAFFITHGGNAGKRLQQIASPVHNRTSNQYDKLYVYERELINLTKSGRRFMGEEFSRTLTQNFAVDMGAVNSSVPVIVKSSVVARSFVPSSFVVRVNGIPVITHNVSAVQASYERPFASDNDGAKSANINVTSGVINVNYTYQQPIPGSLGWLDFFELQSRNFLNLNAGQLYFTDKESFGNGKVTQFQLSTTADAQIWDVTDPTTPVRITSAFSSNTLTFAADGNKQREFLAHNGNYYTPQFVEKVTNQNIHGLAPAEYIIVAHENFLNEANRLAQHHRTKRNLRVHVLPMNQVYNEFSSGVQDITAIRDMLRMFYKRAQVPAELPKYVLLFGRASYDYRNRINNNTNFVPTFESWESFDPVRTYCSDDYFGLLDDNEGKWDSPADVGWSGIKEFLDIGVGRLPATNSENATIMVNKVINYESAPEWGDWMTKLVFVADDEDWGIHQSQANELADKNRADAKKYNVQKIFIDAYPEVTMAGGVRNPQAQDELVRSVERGCLLFNYTGHGGEVGLASERILNTDDIQRWTNRGRLPLMVTATCEFSRYDDPSRFAAGEMALINANGGAIGLFTTVRLVSAGSNMQLNRFFYNYTGLDTASNFNKKSLGEIMRFTKNAYTWNDKNERNFTLLGDPAMFLAYPEWNVATTAINSTPINMPLDTLKAFSRITVSGRITDLNGSYLSTFNGIVYPTVYDKPATYRTLNNNPPSYSSNYSFTFDMQNNVIYRGRATVQNGLFSFSFIVPKDISYQAGFGKISYYADNGVNDAIGFFDGVVVGGTADSVALDNGGPQIQLYLNDEKFVNGSITNENPLLLAKLYDLSGINITGRGIGRDIVMTLDGDNTKAVVLNDYFQAKLDSYQEGDLKFQMKDIEPGKHTLKLTAWDAYNNFSEGTLEFIVANDEEVAIKNVLNYPNPFTTNTTFHFDHNKPGEQLTVMIQVFTLSGKLIKTLRTDVATTGNHFENISWDGRDEFGDTIGKGVYIYKVKLRSSQGKTAEEYQKLVILN